MFSEDLIRTITDDRERSIADELRRRLVTRPGTRGQPERWVRQPKRGRPHSG
jgi:hypothetical protein